MALIQWNNDYLLGIEAIDTQHKQFVGIINEFYENLTSGLLKENTQNLVEKVYEYTEYHFSEEEKLMSSIQYPGLSEHIKIHESIKNTIRDYKIKISNEETVVTMGLTRELREWIKDHILVEDKKYAEYYFQHK